MSEKRILILTPNFPPQNGGAETFTFLLSERMAEDGVGVRIRTAVRNPEIPAGCDVASSLAVPDWLPGGWFFGPFVTCFFSIVFNRLWTKRVFFPQLHAGIAAAWLLRPLLGLEYYVRVPTAAGPDNQLDLICNGKFAFFLQQAFMAADVIIIQNEFDREAVCEMGVNLEIVRCLPNGTDISMFDVVRERRGIGRLTIGCITRLVYAKGADRLLKLLEENDGRFAWRIVGTGEYGEEVASLAAVASEIDYQESISHNMVPEWLSGVDVFLNLSRSEGFCNAILEAMACGIPVVAADIPNNRVFAEYVLLVNADPAADVFTALVDVEKNYERYRDRAGDAAKYVRERYSIDSVASRYAEVFFGGRDGACAASAE